MRNNLKLEIIYYKVNTNFELEFNLCGCYDMRLLTHTANNEKELLTSFATSMTRSQVAVITADFEAEKGIVSLISKAIGTKSVVINESSYGVITGDFKEIIDGSVPLIDSDGRLGGCIIEKGSQSLILLTDNRQVQKEILNSLLFPYIKDFGEAQLDSINENSDNDIPKTETAADITDIDTENIEEENSVRPENDTSADITVDSESVPEVETEIETETETETETPQPQIEDAQIQLPVNSNMGITNDFYFDDDEKSDTLNDNTTVTQQENVVENKKPRSSLLPLSIIIYALIFFLLIFLIYKLIITPIISGVSITDNFINTFSFIKHLV